MSAEEERIRQWKLQLQQELEDEDEDEEDDGPSAHADLIARHPIPAHAAHFDDEPLSDEEPAGVVPSGGEHMSVDNDLGLDLEEPAYRDKAPAHPSSFELPKGVPRTHEGHLDPSAAATQATVDLLESALNEREIEIQRLRRVAAADPELAGRPDDLRDQRLRELAKKNRQLVQVVGKERAQNAALSAEIASLKANPQAAQSSAAPGSARATPASNQSARASPSPGASIPADDSAVIRELREKLATSTGRANELRLAHQALRAELQKYQRALAKEVGEDVPLQKVIEDGGSWRGRAQQITLLKARLGDVRRTASAAGLAADGDAGQLSAVDERVRAQLATKDQVCARPTAT
jgi:hypothetical protein